MVSIYVYIIEHLICLRTNIYITLQYLDLPEYFVRIYTNLNGKLCLPFEMLKYRYAFFFHFLQYYYAWFYVRYNMFEQYVKITFDFLVNNFNRWRRGKKQKNLTIIIYYTRWETRALYKFDFVESWYFFGKRLFIYLFFSLLLFIYVTHDCDTNWNAHMWRVLYVDVPCRISSAS